MKESTFILTIAMAFAVVIATLLALVDEQKLKKDMYTECIKYHNPNECKE